MKVLQPISLQESLISWLLIHSILSHKTHRSITINKSSVCFYIVQYPVHWTAQSALHNFLPWQKMSVNSDTNSATLGSILAMQQLRAKTIHSHFYHCLLLGTHLYDYVPTRRVPVGRGQISLCQQDACQLDASQ